MKQNVLVVVGEEAREMETLRRKAMEDESSAACRAAYPQKAKEYYAELEKSNEQRQKNHICQIALL